MVMCASASLGSAQMFSRQSIQTTAGVIGLHSVRGRRGRFVQNVLFVLLRLILDSATRRVRAPVCHRRRFCIVFGSYRRARKRGLRSVSYLRGYSAGTSLSVWYIKEINAKNRPVSREHLFQHGVTSHCFGEWPILRHAHSLLIEEFLSSVYCLL
jgi:hypothetical protein